jgi:hypothetical protein
MGDAALMSESQQSFSSSVAGFGRQTREPSLPARLAMPSADPGAASSRRQEALFSTSYVIEIGEEAAGIVAPDGRGFRFYAAMRACSALEGAFFASPRQAEAAARRHLQRRRASGRAQAGAVAARGR